METKRRVLGNFPVYGNNDYYPTYNQYEWEKGKVDCDKVLNFVSNGLNYLYRWGTPEWSLNVLYPKGATVIFDGALYISLVDGNNKHITQSTYWAKVQIEPNNSRFNDIGFKPKSTTVDSNPIGTILTVPKSASMVGYIDYVEGQSFNETIYPELYSALGTNRFAADTGTGSSELPLGSLLHVLSSNPNVPNGFIEWKSFTSLVQYPELKAELARIAEQLPAGLSKTEWQNSLSQNQLPRFELAQFYLGIGNSVGMYSQDTVATSNLQSLPVVLDNSQTLNPLGVSRCVVDQHHTTVPAIVNTATGVHQSHTASEYVLVAHRADVHTNVQGKNQYITTVGNSTVTAPKTLSTRLFIKAVADKPSSISSTHKRVIKAFNQVEVKE